jgi:hypothetical protein
MGRAVEGRTSFLRPGNVYKLSAFVRAVGVNLDAAVPETSVGTAWIPRKAGELFRTYIWQECPSTLNMGAGYEGLCQVEGEPGVSKSFCKRQAVAVDRT